VAALPGANSAPGAEATGYGSTAIGIEANASGSGSLAVGNASAASGLYSTMLCTGGLAAGDSSTAVGNASAALGNNSVALGADSIAYRNNVVAVCDSATGLLRQISDVAPGTMPTDAADVGQLDAGLAGANAYTQQMSANTSAKSRTPSRAASNASGSAADQVEHEQPRAGKTCAVLLQECERTAQQLNKRIEP
jgi:hypothetical protein